jgi:hypothetical protein
MRINRRGRVLAASAPASLCRLHLAAGGARGSGDARLDAHDPASSFSAASAVREVVAMQGLMHLLPQLFAEAEGECDELGR